jgi:hypothetical protein
MTFFTRPYDSDIEQPISAIGTSGSRFGSLLASMGRCLNRLFLEPPALFEICNIRTGEAAVQFGRFTDGTLADRAARALGQDWRVFRQESSTMESLGPLCEAVRNSQPPAATVLPTDIHDRLGHGETMFHSSRLSENVRFERGQVTVVFANVVELQERLVSLSLALANESDLADSYSTAIPQEASVTIQHPSRGHR